MTKKISLFLLIGLILISLTSCKINIKTNNSNKTEDDIQIMPPPYIPDIDGNTTGSGSSESDNVTNVPTEENNPTNNETPPVTEEEPTMPEKVYNEVKIVSGFYKVLLASYITGTTSSNSNGTTGTTINKYTENETFEIKNSKLRLRITLNNLNEHTINTSKGKVEKKENEMNGETEFSILNGTGTVILTIDGKIYNGKIVYNSNGKSTYLTKLNGSEQGTTSDYKKETSGQIIWENQEKMTAFTLKVSHNKETLLDYELLMNDIIVDDYKITFSIQTYSFLMNELIGNNCYINSNNCFLVQNIQARE